MKASTSTASRARSSKPARKPRALPAGARLKVFAPSSPAVAKRVEAGIQELQRLGYVVEQTPEKGPHGYFSSSVEERCAEFVGGLKDETADGLVALRGGYGSNYMLDRLGGLDDASQKCIVGFSDLTSLQIFLWQKYGWAGFYGPMVAAGLDFGADQPGGYDRDSLLNALQNARSGWNVPLRGESLSAGVCEGILLGGCMTLVETTLGTPWELDTRGAILLLEDRGMKPWQVDRALMHMLQAGKFEGVKGIVLGDFPECEPPVAGSPTVRDVCARILGPLSVPIIFGAPVGHTERPMLTLPLGIEARLNSTGKGILQILEPAVTE